MLSEQLGMSQGFLALSGRQVPVASALGPSHLATFGNYCT
jgi:hypothetical protein